ncbi:MAG: penicillin-binding protein 1B [Nevskiaceae bacterium]|nr:MAG: penicillin-binding protein 1B [Nevskiaceae bacterium]TBR74767.1 MAG: penicillin-binding protein 1B [Nevskiaceae bacterium]
MARAPKKSPPRGFRKLLLSAAVVAVSITLLVTALVLLHLDRDVQRRFAAVQWVLPAQVYAAPLEIYPGAPLSLAELRDQLDRLGYSSVSVLSGPGTYAEAHSMLDIQTRPFAFWDGAQPSARIMVRGSGKSIASIKDLTSGASLPLVRFDPQLIGSIYPGKSGQDRVLVRLGETPPLLAKALVAVEDRDFYTNVGISFRGILRAALANVASGRIVQGASTLTQQLVKNLFLTDQRTFSRKIREAAMAVLLERHVTKDQILEAYLNEVYLGQDGPRAIRGFGLASQFYFNKPLSELQPNQIALLVGMVKGPSYYNPRRNPKRALARRNVVLQVLEAQGLLKPEQARLQMAEPLGIDNNGTGGPERYPAFIDLVKKQMQGQYSEQDLTLEGLRVFTTLDTEVQQALETRITKGLPGIEKAHRMTIGTLEGAGVVTSVGNGEVLGMVGGRMVHFDGFNRALDTERQIGSLAKPFLYLTAFSDPAHYNPVTPLSNQPVSVKMPNGTMWSPRNFERNDVGGVVPAYVALARSMNIPTVSLGLQVGVKNVVRTFARAGFSNVPDLPSIFLGAIDMSPLEVAQVYSTLAGGGFYTPLQAIRDVVTQDGQPLRRYPLKIQQTLPAGPVYQTVWAMENVLRFGTGRWAQSVLPPGTVLAGKTGTTDANRDSWFAGFGANRVAVIWVGRDDNQPTHLQGATGALRIWAPLMRDLRVQSLDTTPPPTVTDQLVDVTTGLKADAGCPDTITVPFISGYEPQQYAPCANAAHSVVPGWLRHLFE